MSQTSTQVVQVELLQSSAQQASDDVVSEQQDSTPSKTRSAAIIITISSISFLNTLGSGLLTVALPQIAKDLGLPRALLLWPAAIYGLTCGCTLLIAGAIADVVGRRFIFILGSIILSAFTLGCGLCQTYMQLIVFRGFQGVAIAFCLPSGVGIISNVFPPGQRRNIAFAALGGGQPVGYAVGLVLGGFFVESIGWRYGYYLGTICNGVITAVAVWSLNAGESTLRGKQVWRRMKEEIDWVGAGIASTSLAMLFYVFAVLTAGTSKMKDTMNIIILSIALALLPAFIFWVGWQERKGKPAIIPNSLWKNAAFTCICLAVFLTWAAFNSFGYFASLFFQEAQLLSPIQTSIRFLPTVVCGAATNLVTGFLVKSIPASVLVTASTILTGLAYLLMAIADVHWSYWYAAFPAILLSPICSDVLYTTSMLIVTSVFPQKTQSLAGGVFNTISQIGNAVGLAVGGVIASTVNRGKGDIHSLVRGYHATFWAALAASLIVGVISLGGLRKAGKVGQKVD